MSRLGPGVQALSYVVSATTLVVSVTEASQLGV